LGGRLGILIIPGRLRIGSVVTLISVIGVSATAAGVTDLVAADIARIAVTFCVRGRATAVGVGAGAEEAGDPMDRGQDDIDRARKNAADSGKEALTAITAIITNIAGIVAAVVAVVTYPTVSADTAGRCATRLASRGTTDFPRFIATDTRILSLSVLETSPAKEGKRQSKERSLEFHFDTPLKLCSLEMNPFNFSFE
jgi:hypothetical protein